MRAMTASKNLICELEEAIAHKDIGRRAETLRRLTDLFVLGSVKYTGEQVALFDEVMRRLLEEVEVSARAAFGNRLATVANAPPKLMRNLALDNAIEVAGPVLTHSEQLDDETLVESAKTKSQDHLLAISRRKRLTEDVTDVLVDRGTRQVALSTADNPGAAFSDFGYSTLVRRSQQDDMLAVRVWSRMDVPRQHLLRLFAEASESVRLTLEATDRRKAELIRGMVMQASNKMQSTAREESASYAAAFTRVQRLKDAGALNEAQLSGFASAGRFDETVIALSMLCELPVGPIERAFAQNWSEQLLVLAKAIDLSWETTKSLLLLQSSPDARSEAAINDCFASFIRLHSDTAKKALHFYRLREKASVPVSY
jgi:uncharacterized protein (DUF2336 family)